MEYNYQIIVPIVNSSRDAIGCIIMISDEEELTEKEESILKVGAIFLGKQAQ